ncbi:MAG: FAD-dependent oxidoreductase [Bacillota bacterium]|nr:FAD-dependent oxidoreductase [Bacillota bacterium]
MFQVTKRFSKLFEPIKIKNVEIKNRYSMAPMGPIGFTDSNGAFTQEGIDYYVERAKGGTGLIITGICNADSEIEETFRPTIPCPTINPSAFVMSASVMTERVHAYNAKIFLQLTAGFGRAGLPKIIKTAIAPSPIENRWNPSLNHRAMTVEEITKMIQRFAESAAIAKQAGFDGVEIHAVHEGYLLDQFTMALYNKRTDQYGGNLENRLRFAIEIVQAIKAVCGEDFPVSLRFSLKGFVKGIRQGALPGEEFEEMGRDIEEGLEAAKMLVEAGYDALNVDVGTYDSWYWNHPPMYFEDGMYLPFSKLVKDAVDVPVIVAGRMDNPELAARALEEGLTDIIGLGRPLLADPFLPNKVRTGKVETIRPCLSCHDGCMGRIAQALPLSCAVNPSCGREVKYAVASAHKKKKVMVIGGGVAGMEAARVSALRGHEVTIYEKGNRLGGVVIPGGMPSFKKDDHALIRWYEQELAQQQVKINFNTVVTKELVLAEKADTVIVATGSKPILLNLPGKEQNQVVTAEEVLLNQVQSGDSIVVIGGGLVGCEAALWLAQKGKQVTVVEASSDICGGPHGIPFMNYDMLKDLLAYHNVEIMKDSLVSEITSEGVLVKTLDGTVSVNADTVILSVGYTSVNSLYKELESDVEELYLLGDAKRVKNIMYAIWDAYEVARQI